MDKEQRYGLKLKVATALHEHRTHAADHSGDEEWWCCVEAVMRVFEEFLDEDRHPIRTVERDLYIDDTEHLQGSKYIFTPAGTRLAKSSTANPFAPLGDSETTDDTDLEGPLSARPIIISGTGEKPGRADHEMTDSTRNPYELIIGPSTMTTDDDNESVTRAHP